MLEKLGNLTVWFLILIGIFNNITEFVKSPILWMSLCGIVAVALFGWGIYEAIKLPREGTVIEKIHQDGHYYEVTVSTPHFYTDSDGDINVFYTYHQEQRYDDEDWIVRIRKTDEGDGRTRSRYVFISSNTYDTIALGDWYEYNPETDFLSNSSGNSPIIEHEKMEMIEYEN